LLLWLQKRKAELRSLPPAEDGNRGLPGLLGLRGRLAGRKGEVHMAVGDNTSTSLGNNHLTIEFPSSKDILLGSGFIYQNFPGNQYFITVVEMHVKSHMAASDQMKKTAISKQVMKVLRESGSRFLRRGDNEENGWVQVDAQTAFQKVSHAFRNIRRRDGRILLKL
jgi:hypothetical protein